MKGLFQQLIESCRNRRNARRATTGPHRACPSVEPLEDRAVPSASPLNACVDAFNLYNNVARASKSSAGQGAQIGKAVMGLAHQVIVDEINNNYSAAVNDSSAIGALLLVQLSNTPKASQAAFISQVWAPYSQLYQDASSILAAARSNLSVTASLLNHNSSVASQEAYYLNNMVTS